MPAGPEIPPHILEKRKRDAESSETASPSPPPEAKKAKSVGPPLPPSGPTLPSVENAHKHDKPRVSGPTGPPSAPSGPTRPPRVYGPSAPPAPLDERPTIPADSDSDSSDDDIGPALPGAKRSAAEEEAAAVARLAKYSKATPNAKDDGKPKRDEWMLAPPDPANWGARVDPTKLKSRKFASGKGAQAPKGANVGPSTLWTETPEERAQRLADEVMGVRAVATQDAPPTRRDYEAEEAAETARRIREQQQSRGSSLVARHQKTNHEEEDDPSKRAFDREKDIAGGIKISSRQKKEMLDRASDFGSRFSSGNFL